MLKSMISCCIKCHLLAVLDTCPHEINVVNDFLFIGIWKLPQTHSHTLSFGYTHEKKRNTSHLSILYDVYMCDGMRFTFAHKYTGKPRTDERKRKKNLTLTHSRTHTLSFSSLLLLLLFHLHFILCVFSSSVQ